MARFIELHDTQGKLVLFNSDWIIEVKSDNKGGSCVSIGCAIGSLSNGGLNLSYESKSFKESYLTVKNMLGMDY
jgi:hypothetical protein